MQGRLYNLGRYPGATPSDGSNDWVRGEVFRLRQPAKLLAQLDAYEGPQFARVPQRVYLATGMTLAWVYLYRGNPAGTRIVSGKWRGQGAENNPNNRKRGAMHVLLCPQLVSFGVAQDFAAGRRERRS
jgi:gamma-glutamylcyclotransferase (GGCT)/AIG2-like uncharacterized protein YtfP